MLRDEIEKAARHARTVAALGFAQSFLYTHVPLDLGEWDVAWIICPVIGGALWAIAVFVLSLILQLLGACFCRRQSPRMTPQCPSIQGMPEATDHGPPPPPPQHPSGR
jgi:hypothetical protein